MKTWFKKPREEKHTGAEKKYEEKARGREVVSE